MKTWISWAIWTDKWCQNELKWRLEYHKQYGWTNDAKINSNWRVESHEQYGWTNDAKVNSNEDLNPMSNMDWQMMPKWTQMKIWIPWAIWMDKWCQMNSNEDLNPMSNMDGQMMPNELKWRLESHEQYGWTNDAKMNSNEDLNTMSNMDGQMMPKWTQMKTWIPRAILMDKWCQNELKWRLESHKPYGCTNYAKMNSIEESNPMSNMDGQMMQK